VWRKFHSKKHGVKFGRGTEEKKANAVALVERLYGIKDCQEDIAEAILMAEMVYDKLVKNLEVK